MPNYQPGLHHMKAATYHADPMERPSLTSTLGRLIVNRSPHHAFAASPRLNLKLAAKLTKKHFAIGKAAHREVLGAGEPWVVIPSTILSKDGATSTKEAKAFIAQAESEGVTPLKQVDADSIIAMRDALYRNLKDTMVVLQEGKPAEKLALDPAYSEMAALATIGGCPCRALFDNLPPNLPYFLDLKTCDSAAPEACIRAITAYGYDVQMAHYRACLKATTGEDRRAIIIFQEKTEPFETFPLELLARSDADAEWFRIADDKCNTARFWWLRGIETGDWPGYPRLVGLAGAPAWYVNQWEHSVFRARSARAMDLASRSSEPEDDPFDAANWKHGEE